MKIKHYPGKAVIDDPGWLQMDIPNSTRGKMYEENWLDTQRNLSAVRLPHYESASSSWSGRSDSLESESLSRLGRYQAYGFGGKHGRNDNIAGNGREDYVQADGRNKEDYERSKGDYEQSAGRIREDSEQTARRRREDSEQTTRRKREDSKQADMTYEYIQSTHDIEQSIFDNQSIYDIDQSKQINHNNTKTQYSNNQSKYKNQSQYHSNQSIDQYYHTHSNQRTKSDDYFNKNLEDKSRNQTDETSSKSSGSLRVRYHSDKYLSRINSKNRSDFLSRFSSEDNYYLPSQSTNLTRQQSLNGDYYCDNSRGSFTLPTPKNRKKLDKEDKETRLEEIKESMVEVRKEAKDIKSQNKNIKSQSQDVKIQSRDIKSLSQDIKLQSQDINLQSQDLTSHNEDVKSQDKNKKLKDKAAKLKNKDTKLKDKDVNFKDNDIKTKDKDIISIDTILNDKEINSKVTETNLKEIKGPKESKTSKSSKNSDNSTNSKKNKSVSRSNTLSKFFKLNSSKYSDKNLDNDNKFDNKNSDKTFKILDKAFKISDKSSEISDRAFRIYNKSSETSDRAFKVSDRSSGSSDKAFKIYKTSKISDKTSKNPYDEIYNNKSFQNQSSNQYENIQVFSMQNETNLYGKINKIPKAKAEYFEDSDPNLKKSVRFHDKSTEISFDSDFEDACETSEDRSKGSSGPKPPVRVYMNPFGDFEDTLTRKNNYKVVDDRSRVNEWVDDQNKYILNVDENGRSSIREDRGNTEDLYTRVKQKVSENQDYEVVAHNNESFRKNRNIFKVNEEYLNTKVEALNTNIDNFEDFDFQGNSKDFKTNPTDFKTNSKDSKSNSKNSKTHSKGSKDFKDNTKGFTSEDYETNNPIDIGRDILEGNGYSNYVFMNPMKQTRDTSLNRNDSGFYETPKKIRQRIPPQIYSSTSPDSSDCDIGLVNRKSPTESEKRVRNIQEYKIDEENGEDCPVILLGREESKAKSDDSLVDAVNMKHKGEDYKNELYQNVRDLCLNDREVFQNKRGFKSNGRPNGFTKNGYTTNGFNTNGYTTSGHTSNVYSTKEYTANEYTKPNVLNKPNRDNGHYSIGYPSFEQEDYSQTLSSKSTIKPQTYQSIGPHSNSTNSFSSKSISSPNDITSDSQNDSGNTIKVNSKAKASSNIAIDSQTLPKVKRNVKKNTSEGTNDFLIPRPKLIVPVHTYGNRRRRTGNLKSSVCGCESISDLPEYSVDGVDEDDGKGKNYHINKNDEEYTQYQGCKLYLEN